MTPPPSPRPARRGPSPEKTARTRARLCAAALDLFLDRGFEHTRMSDVAQAAGVAKGTAYLYFATKETLFEAVLTGELSIVLDNLRPEPVDPDEPFGTMLRRILGPFLADPLIERRLQLLRIVMVEGPRFPAVAGAIAGRSSIR